jgi:hypothetical protein
MTFLFLVTLFIIALFVAVTGAALWIDRDADQHDASDS